VTWSSGIRLKVIGYLAIVRVPRSNTHSPTPKYVSKTVLIGPLLILSVAYSKIISNRRRNTIFYSENSINVEVIIIIFSIFI